MKSFLKNYKSAIILLGSVILGGILGIILGDKASVLEPFGTLFVNLIFTIIVPLVFFTVSSSIANMKEMKRLGKILGSALSVFIATGIISAVIGLIGALIFNPTKGIDISMFSSLMSDSQAKQSDTSLLNSLVSTFTVSDFSLVLSRSNMLQLIVFSILIGVSAALAGEKAKPFASFLSSGTSVMMKLMNIIMYYAPFGLACYFASMIGQLGAQILNGYLKVFLLYVGLSIVYYFGFFTLYAFIAGGRKGIVSFWKNAVVPSVTSLATCSSAACIPVNIEYSKKMGVTDDIAETVLPLGANIHKDGSVFGGVMKMVFIYGLFGWSMTTPKAVLGIIGVSFLVGAVMGAIPNGGMIGETLIVSVYGLSPSFLPILAVISTIIDAPATLLNSTGNTVCSMIIARMVEKKSIGEGDSSQSFNKPDNNTINTR